MRPSLAWAEMSLLLAKIIFLYDMELASKDLVWERDAKNYMLWAKPALRVRFVRRMKESCK
jgi:hypothetical protein